MRWSTTARATSVCNPATPIISLIPARRIGVRSHSPASRERRALPDRLDLQDLAKVLQELLVRRSAGACCRRNRTSPARKEPPGQRDHTGATGATGRNWPHLDKAPGLTWQSSTES